MSLLNNKNVSSKKWVVKKDTEAKFIADLEKKMGMSPALSPFRGVSQVDVAPVSMGNTVRSVRQQITPTKDGVRIVGRDYVQTVGGIASTINNWCLVGGTSLSPVALNASGLRGFFQSYERYKWNKSCVHYITSSPTSTSGDILLVYHANHGGPKVNHLSNNFLSYALSTDSALIGPQWTNHSVEIIRGQHEWRGTDILNAEDVEHQADGELLVYAKNTTNAGSADPPGYVLIDYDISFSRRMLNPRVQTIPSALFKWFPTGLSFSGLITQYDAVVINTGTTSTYSGATGTLPPNTAVGDVFQIVLDFQAPPTVFGGTLTAGSEATMWVTNAASSGNLATTTINVIAYPVTTGATLYGVCTNIGGSGIIVLCPSYEAAFSGATLRWAAGSVGAALTCPMAMCCVGSVNNVFLQANIG